MKSSADVLVPIPNNKKHRALLFGKNRQGTFSFHIMMLPAVILLLIYSYLPMVGLVMAFQDFDVAEGWKGFFTSKWVGLEHFQRILKMDGSIQALVNTLVISAGKIITMLIIPIIIALLLNEIRSKFVKRGVQTLIYLPHFLSWVILAGVLKNILAPDGLINNLAQQLIGRDFGYILGDAGAFPHILIWSNVWQEVGFSTIVYLAAITNVDPELYEAAIVDGANRWKQTIHVTLPAMKPIIILMAVLSLGSILNAGFDQIFNLYSVPVYKTGDVIDTFVYRIGVQGGQFSLGAAVGLFKSVVSFILVSFSYWSAKKFANYEIF